MYEGTGADRKISGEHTFTVSEHDGKSATVTSDEGGSYTMPRDAVKHFADDLNHRVDVPEHPSHAGINAVRDGSAQFLGKGHDGLVFDTGDGQVAKVTTSVPYNLAYFREHRHAIADARKQAELNNQAIADGHDLLLPQQFIEHGEKGFTTMPRLDLDAKLSREQILEYREKMKAFHAAGWDIGDQVQTGVDDQGNIRIYDTGNLHRRDTSIENPIDDDPQGMLKHAGKLLREHGHYDDESLDNDLKIRLRHFEWAATYPQYAEHLAKEAQNVNLTLQTMIQNDHDAADFVIDDVREVLGKIPDSEHKQEIATLVDFWESNKTNEIMDARMLDAQAQFADLVTEYEGIDEDDEPHDESLDSFITDRDLFEQMVPDLDAPLLALLAFKSYESYGEDINLAGFAMDEDAIGGYDDDAKALKAIAAEQEKLGLNLQGEELEAGQETMDGGHYEPDAEPDMDTFMRNQYPEGYSWLESGFLLADGTLLDMSYGQGQRADDHRNINPTEGAAARWGYQPDMAKNEFSRWGILTETLRRANAFRIDGESGLLHMETAPTGPQERSIADYINEAEPGYLAIRFGETEWMIDNPSASQVLSQIESVAAGDGLPGTGEMSENDLVDLDTWTDRNSAFLTPLDEIDFSSPDSDLHINPEGYDIPAMNDLDTDLDARLAAMNPGVHISERYGITLLGMPTNQQLLALATYIDENAMDTIDFEFMDENGNIVLTEQIESDEYLDGVETAEAIGKYFQLVPVSQERRKQNLQRWAQGSKVVDEQGNPLVLYHGTARPDKIGNKFDKKKATSGPMPYFTDSTKVSSGYAQNKPYAGHEDADLYDGFTLDGMSLTDAWDQMPISERESFIETLPKVQRNQEGNGFELGDDAPVSADHLEYQANQGNIRDTGRETRGNYLAAAYNTWVGGGMLHPNTEELRDVLDAAGIPKHRMKFNDPYGHFSGVFPVFIRMQKPLYGNDVPRDVVDAIDARAEIESKRPKRDIVGVDAWDKNSQEPLEYAKSFRQATTHTKYKNDNSYIWTSIPDWVTDVFEGFGYDGIIDKGNKGGSGQDHQVYIPFEENQIKSAIGNTGAFSPGDKRITYAADDDAGIDRPATPEPATPKRPEWGLDAGEGQKLIRAKSREQIQQRQETLADDSPAIDPDHMEPYEHVTPEPLPTPEPDQSARDELKKRWTQAGFGESPQDTSGIRGILRRNRDMALKDKTFLPDQNDLLKNLDIDDLDDLHDRAHPKRPEQPTGWENDDYLYHIAKVDNAEQIQEEGLRPNQPSNFSDGLRWNIEGNVFLTEKEGVQTWQEHVGEMAADKLEQQAYDIAGELHAALAGVAVPGHTHAEKQEIEEKIISLTKQKESIDSRLAEHEHDTTGHTKVFRVPKSHIQDYVAVDEAGTKDARADAFKLNNYVTERVKWAKQQTGKTQQKMSSATKAIKEHNKNLKVFTAAEASADAEVREARNTLQDLLQAKSNEIHGRNPQPVPIQYRVVDEDGIEVSGTPDDTGRLQFDRVLGRFVPSKRSTLQLKDTTAPDEPWVNLMTQPGGYGNPEEHFESFMYDGFRPAAPGEQPDDDIQIHWRPEQIEQGGTKTVTDRWQWFADPERAMRESWQKYDDWLQTSGLGQYRELRSEIFNLFPHGENLPTELRLGISSRRSMGVNRIEWLTDLQDRYADKAEYKPIIQAAMAEMESRIALGESEQGLIDFENENDAHLQSNLTTLAKGQLRNMQLQVASNPNYWRWAKDNYAVDAEGLPLIIFHGTQKGGFGMFGRLDVPGHIYGSTDVPTGATYSGGFTDDVTPALATSVQDIEQALKGSKHWEFVYDPDGPNSEYYEAYQIIDTKDGTTVLDEATEGELVVSWNQWQAENALQGVQARGVYPLVYRLTNPMVIDGEDQNWNEIPFLPMETSLFDENWRDVLALPQTQAWIKHRPGGNQYGNADIKANVLDFLSQQLIDKNDESRKFFPFGIDQRVFPIPNFNNVRADVMVDNIRNAMKRIDALRTDGAYGEFGDTEHQHPGTDGYVQNIMEILGEEIAAAPTDGSHFWHLTEDQTANRLMHEIFKFPDTMTTREFAKVAEHAGHDGIVWKNIIDHGGHGGETVDYLDPADVYVAFTKEQVKSAHNTGAFAEMGDKREHLMYQATA